MGDPGTTVRVHTVSPGGTGTGVDRQPTDRAGRPEDLAAVPVAADPVVTNALLDIDEGERAGTISR